MDRFFAVFVIFFGYGLAAECKFFFHLLNPFIPSGLFHINSLDRFVSSIRSAWSVFFITIFIAIPDLNTNNVDPDQTPSSVASDLDRNCLPMSIFSRRQSDCILFLFFTKSWIWHFMQIVSIRDTLHKNVKSCFLGRIRKNITKCRLLKILPRVLSVVFFFFCVSQFHARRR